VSARGDGIRCPVHKPKIGTAWGRVSIMIGIVGVSLTPQQSADIRRQLLECENALLGVRHSGTPEDELTC
jgi:hypothetical protein